MGVRLGHDGIINIPNLILQTRNFENICGINNFTELEYKNNLNSANEISFTIYKEDNLIHWDEIVDNKLIYIPDYKERFNLSVTYTGEGCIFKKITATSLCESELSQLLIKDIEINTENDIARDGYSNVWDNYDVNFPTVFYRDWEHPEKYDWSNRNGQVYTSYTLYQKQMILFHSSLLHRLFSKAPHYTIGNIDTTLWNIQRTFSFSDTDLYSALTDTISKEIGCIFIFDSLTRTVNVYDMYSTCNSCGYRGDYSDICPECKSDDIYGQYGVDTTILIDKENLASSISLESKSDSLKNTFYVEGGDDVINSAIRMCNPNGSQSIIYCSSETLSDMPTELSNKLKDYETDYNNFLNKKRYELPTDEVSKYNDVVNYVKEKFSSDVSISSQYSTLPSYTKYGLNYSYLDGYKELSKYIYQTIDLYYFVKTSMLPTINLNGLGIDDSLQNIINGFNNGLCTLDESGNVVESSIFKNTIAVSSPTTAITSTVNNTVKNTVKLFCSTAYYDLSVDGKYSYDSQTNLGKWSGTVTITSLTETDEDTGNKKSKTTNLELSVVDNLDLFISQQICYSNYHKDKLEITQILGLDMTDDMFKQQLNLYSLDELNIMLKKFENCLGVINNLSDTSANVTGTDGKKLIKCYYTFYHNRLDYITKELVARNDQLKAITDIYSLDNENGLLNVTKTDVQNFLNFEKYLGEDLYKVFCAYRREDTYSNTNYISDGLSDAEIVDSANKLLEIAKKELYKDATPQWTLTATIGNLLLIDDFAPIIEYFNTGNWIRVRIESDIYKLRLLSYDISYSDLTQISVEFSTVENVYNSISDVTSVLDSVSSFATSYDYIEKQAEKADSLNSIYKQWLNEGLNATLIKYVNADNQVLVIDENGLLARAWDFELNDYSPYQLKIINNGLYTTHNSWDSIDTGIGRISYYDPILEKDVDDYGVIAKTLVGHLILGENLVIANCNNNNKSTVIIDSDGITLDGGCITWKNNKLDTNDIDGLDQKIKDGVKNSDELAEYKKELDNFKTDVNTQLSVTGVTKINNNYVYSPKIASGYLYIYKDGCSVQIDPSQEYSSSNTKVINVQANNKDVFYVTRQGNGYFNGDVVANSLTLGSSVSISTDKISGLSTVAKTGKYSDLSGSPDLTVYAKSSDVDTKLNDYAKTNQLKDYLKTNDLSTKLDGLNVSYNGDVSVSQNTNSTTGLITTTSTYKDSNGVSHSYTTYTYSDANYVLLNRENKWGTGTTAGDGNNLVKISKDGLLTANNAVIYGTIHATDGEFSGTIHATDGEFSGTIHATDGGIGCWSITDENLFYLDSIKKLNFPMYINGEKSGTLTTLFECYSYLGRNSDENFGVEFQSYDEIGITRSIISDSEFVLQKSYNSFEINEDGSFIEANMTLGSFKRYMSIYTTTIDNLNYLGKGTIFNGGDSNSISLIMQESTVELNEDNMYITLNKELPYFAKENVYKLYRKDIPSIILHKSIECLENIYNHGNMVFTTDDGNGLWCRLNNLSNPTTARMMRSNCDSTNKYYTLNISDNNFQYTCLYGKTVKLQGVSGTTVTSDERLKNSFKTLDEFDDVFMDIEPCGFKYNNGTSGRTHFGAKAQNIKDAFEKHGYTTKDFAGFVQMTDDKTSDTYCGIDDPMGLIYTEFTMWNTHMIQKTIKENMILKERISKLEALLNQ